MNNYHMLPCGTPIPPEGIEAWVRDSSSLRWEPRLIVAFADNRAIIHKDHCLSYYRHYSLTDPTKQKRRLVTPMELLGKYVHFKCGAISLIVCVVGDKAKTYNHAYDMDELANNLIGYSDTPTSPIKSFWVEEV